MQFQQQLISTYLVVLGLPSPGARTDLGGYTAPNEIQHFISRKETINLDRAHTQAQKRDSALQREETEAF